MRARLFLALGSLLLLAGATFVLYAQARFFSAALAQAGASEKVEAGGEMYAVSGGIAFHDGKQLSLIRSLPLLQLAYAKTLARRSPLFALPGTDPQALMRSIDLLQETESSLAAAQAAPEEQALVRNALYPLEFLRRAAALEEARGAFLASGSEEDRERYDSAAAALVAAYTNDLLRFRAAATAAIPERDASYDEAGLLVNKDNVLRALDSLEIGMDASAKRWRERELCVQGALPLCNTQELSVPSLPSVPASTGEKEFLQARAVQALYAQALSQPAVQVSPLIELSHSDCAARDRMPPLFSLAPARSPVDGAPFTEPFLMGDIRLLPVASYPSDPFFSALAARGIRYALANPLLHYECAEYGRDLGELFAVDAVRAAADGTLGNPARERDAAAYVTALEESGEQSQRDRGTELALQMLDHSSAFGSIVRAVVETEQSKLRARERGVSAGLDAGSLFLFRSAFAVLFMADNPSFTGAHGRLFPADEENTSSPYLLLSSSSSPSFKHQVLEDISSYKALYR